MTKSPKELIAFAASDLPDPLDDEAFHAEMAFVDSEADVAAFAAAFGVARTTVRGWCAGRYAPSPSLRSSYCTWLRGRAAELANQRQPREIYAAAVAVGKSSKS